MTMIPRRTFLRQGTVAAGLAAQWATRSNAADANETISVGIMGVKGRGRDLTQSLVKLKDVNIAYVCDVDESVIEPTLKVLSDAGRPTPTVVTDFRKILDDKSVDALVVATPDHWHAPATIHACLAGKHVYVEKPASHNIVEGRRMVEAARKYDRKVQVGTQRRSAEGVASLVEFLQSGALGKIHFCRTWITSMRENIGRAKDEPTPPGVNYDLWLGAAPNRPFNRNHFHYRWHWFWEYGTGELGNNGIHGLDLARWGLGVDQPLSVVSSGGKFYFDDDQITPDTQLVVYEYPGLNLVWEHRTWSPYGINDSSFGVIFHGEKGILFTDGNIWKVEGVAGVQPQKIERAGDLTQKHFANWIQSIKEDKQPSADVAIGHASTTLCHIGNISQKLGRRIHWDGATEAFTEEDANSLRAREYRSPWELPKV
ncbi:MAG: Gfo/Idh/MocA family oxidoreductase [Planctomycetota bacterium]